MTALIILAAGLSRRFGDEDKLLAMVGHKPLAQHVTDALAPFAFSARYVVIGADAPQRLDVFKGYTAIINDAPHDGQWRSLRLGAKAALAGGASRALIALSDMPLVPASHYRALIDAKCSAMTAVNGVSQPPALFTVDDLEALSQLSSGQKGKDILGGSPHHVELEPRYGVDVDTRDDLAKLSQG